MTPENSETSERPRRLLRGIPEIRNFFRTNTVPIYFVGATPFNLMGLDRWVRNFSYISYHDAWDSSQPRFFTPKAKLQVQFSCGEEINNYLLMHPEVRAFMARGEGRPKVSMVFFDEETERICATLGYDLILPPAQLRTRLDSKIVTTRLGNEAGARSVPNVLVTVDSWDTLVEVATGADLGTDLVIQMPYGDSGKTTFFLSGASDWTKYGGEIVGQEAKVMKRINHHAVAVEAVLTRLGTIVGPFMTELTGYPELTPYKGGWCGNEIFHGVLSLQHRAVATDLVRRLGDRLADEGYLGFFEVDILVDTDTNEVYLGELNPRISGASSITNVTAGAYTDMPLFLFHLLEYMDVDFEFDIDEINARWQALASEDLWSQMILKQTSGVVERIDTAPRTGQWYLDGNDVVRFRWPARDWHQLQNESEFFFLRIYGPGDYRWKGADLGILVARGRLQADGPADGTDGSMSKVAVLTDRARMLIDAIRSQFSGTPIREMAAPTTVDGIK